MADEQQETAGPDLDSIENDAEDEPVLDLNLQNFITEQYEQQKKDGKLEATEELDAERSANFFSRALKESQRMSAEVQKSHHKIEALHGELGEAMFVSWRNEHASQVLQPHEAAAVEAVSHPPVTG